MEGYQVLLNVQPTSSKSKYPFVIMDELQVKKTRKYIDLEFIDALQALKKKKYGSNDQVKGGGATASIGTILFLEL